MKKKFIIPFSICSGIFITALIILTFHDYGISERFYKSGLSINKVLEVIGPIFMPFFVIYSTVSLIISLKFKKKVTQVLAYVGLIIVYLYAFFMGCMTLKHSYCPILFIPSIVLYILFTILMVFLNLKVFKNEKYIDRHIKICLVMLIVVLTSLAITDIIKTIFSRARYFEILEGKANYHPWYYLTGRWVLNSSFPSGHVTRSGTSMCFALFFFYKKNRSNWIYVVELVATIFTVWVALSRVVEGMHFATDILAGFYLINVSYFLSKHLVC